MTIIVQGMGIPEGCFVCPLKKFNSNDLNYYCPYIKDKAKVSSYLPGSRRHPNCPCKEVPTPHGRLVDADELLKDSETIILETIYDHEEVEEMIKDAPTVIEAEEVNND